ncbi:histone-lysine N-methyltransferase EHMT2-like [Diadema antillarum]|uniref:histone-lysine N-methyltransferase EHMT2-like n=1 Tax=Diadema antillarum TaxID=105358 RepID=UPI003A8AEC03
MRTRGKTYRYVGEVVTKPNEVAKTSKPSDAVKVVKQGAEQSKPNAGSNTPKPSDLSKVAKPTDLSQSAIPTDLSKTVKATDLSKAAKSTDSSKSTEAGSDSGDAPPRPGPALPPAKSSEQKGSDSDSELSQRRRSGRRATSKLTKDSEGGSSAEETENEEDRGREAVKATGDKTETPKGEENASMQVGAGGELSQEPVAECSEPLQVETKGADDQALPGSAEKLSPGRVMKARKSFPAKKARGGSADSDDDEDSIEEYVEMAVETSDQAESDDAFEMAPLPGEDTQSQGGVSSSTDDSNKPDGSLDSASSTSGSSMASDQAMNKEMSSMLTSDKKQNRLRTNIDQKSGLEVSLPTVATPVADIAQGSASSSNAASKRTLEESSAVDVEQLAAGRSRKPMPSNTLMKPVDPSGTQASKDSPFDKSVREQLDHEPSVQQAAAEPVVGAVAESQTIQSGASTPVADFPVGNAGSVIPDRTAIPRGMPVKRSTRHRKPTHFGQHSKRKRHNKNISDSDSTDRQSECSGDARFPRKKVRRSNSSSTHTSHESSSDHSYALKNKQAPVPLTLPDAAGDNPKRGLEPPLCCCKMEQERPATVVATTCEALEVVKGNIAVCGNKVESMTVLRPSTRIPYRALCPDHRLKMLEHKCCPGCGCFCSTGSVMSCTMEKVHHNFHKECIREIEGTLYCPHCGDDATFAKEVKLPVTPELEKMKTLPGSVLLSYGQIKLPRALLETLTGISGTVLNSVRNGRGQDQTEAAAKDKTKARISSKRGKTQGTPAENGVAQASPNEKKITLKNGITISTASLPDGPSKETLEKAMEFLDPVNPKRQRFHPKNLFMSSTQGEVDKVLQMLSEGFDPNYRFPAHNLETPLHGAAAKGHLDIICLLLQSGANIEAVDANLATPLHAAAENSHLACVQYLVKCGANINHKDDEGSTPLHIATKSGNMDMLGYLLTLGKIDLNLQDNGGWTPVIWGADYKNAVSVRFLLEHGADALVRDKEQNIGLHWAAYSGCQDVMEVFLNHSKDNKNHLNALNVHGDTPLHISARENHYGCAMQLLVRHADVTIKNNESELALDCAKPKSDVYLAIQANIRMKMAIKRRNIRSEVILSRDIAHGLENVPIPVVNAVNNDGVPTDFLYVKDNCETSRLNIDRNIKHMQGCNCEDDCFSEACACSRSSVRCWYDKDGRLMPDFNYQEPPMIFECNRACRCWRNCRNRVVQNGLRQHMQVFRTPSMGWAVRTMQDVPRGSFICEYAGELLSDADADQRQDDSYLFDLDNREGDVYCIDARFYGNVSRFINHRCEPNIVPVRVFVDHQDLRFPRIAFFASRDIRAYEELGFDYGDKFWAIKSKYFLCCCGAPTCKHKEPKKSHHLLMTAQPSSK